MKRSEICRQKICKVNKSEFMPVFIDDLLIISHDRAIDAFPLKYLVSANGR